MFLNSYIHEQLAAAHRRDLLEAAERARLAAQPREHRRPLVELTALRRGVRSRPVVQPGVCASCPPIATP